MKSIITDIVKIIKSENNVIAREKALMCYFFDLIRELMKLALEEVDAGLVEETKNWGRTSFWKAHGIKYLNVWAGCKALVMVLSTALILKMINLY